MNTTEIVSLFGTWPLVSLPILLFVTLFSYCGAGVIISSFEAFDFYLGRLEYGEAEITQVFNSEENPGGYLLELELITKKKERLIENFEASKEFTEPFLQEADGNIRRIKTWYRLGILTGEIFIIDVERKSVATDNTP